MTENIDQINSSIALVGEDGVGKFTIAKTLCEPYHAPRSAGRGPSRYIFKDNDLRSQIMSCYRGFDDLNLQYPERCGLLVVTPSIAGSISQDTKYERHEVLYKLIKNLVHLGVEDFVFVLTHIDKLPNFKEAAGKEEHVKRVTECQYKIEEFVTNNQGKINFHCDYVPLFKNKDGVVENIDSGVSEELNRAGYPNKSLLDAIKQMIKELDNDKKSPRHPGWMSATVVRFPKKSKHGQPEQSWALLPKYVARKKDIPTAEPETNLSAYVYKDDIEAERVFLQANKYIYTPKNKPTESLRDRDELVLLEDLSLKNGQASIGKRYYSTNILQVSLNEPNIWEKEKNDISLEATLFGAQRCPCSIEELEPIETRESASVRQWSVKLSTGLVASTFSEDSDAGRILIRRRRADGSMETLDTGRILDIAPFDLLRCLRYFFPMQVDTKVASQKPCVCTNSLVNELSALIHKVFSNNPYEQLGQEIENYRISGLNCSYNNDSENKDVDKFKKSINILCNELLSLRNKKKRRAIPEAIEKAFKDTISGFIQNPVGLLCSHVSEKRPNTEAIIRVSSTGLFSTANNSTQNNTGQSAQNEDSLIYIFKSHKDFDNVYWAMDEILSNVEKHGPHDDKRAWVFVDRPRIDLENDTNTRIWVIDNGDFNYIKYDNGKSHRHGLREHVFRKMEDISGRLLEPDARFNGLNTAIGLEFPVRVRCPGPPLLRLEEALRFFWEYEVRNGRSPDSEQSRITKMRQGLSELSSVVQKFKKNKDEEKKRDSYQNYKQDLDDFINRLKEEIKKDSGQGSDSSWRDHIATSIDGLKSIESRLPNVSKTLDKLLDHPLEWIVEGFSEQSNVGENQVKACHFHEDLHKASLVKDSFVWFKDTCGEYINNIQAAVEYPTGSNNDSKGTVSLTIEANQKESAEMIQKYVRLWRTRLLVLDIESYAEVNNNNVLKIFIPLQGKKGE